MLAEAQDPFERWWLRHQSSAAWVLAAFVLGSLVGALALNALTPHDRLVLHAAVAQFVNQGARGVRTPPLFGQAVLDNLKVLGLIYALGVSVAGLPLVLLALFFRGFVLGFAVGFFVNTMPGAGVGVALVAIVLPNLVLVPAWLVAGSGGLAFASRLLRTADWRRGPPLARAFADYTLVTLAGAALVVVGSALQTLAAPLLLHWLAPWGV